MKTVTIYNHDGSEAGNVELPDDIFGVEPSIVVLHQVMKSHLANRRQGTAAAKTRSKVNVTKSKPFRQKGTGRARSGSANSPVWVGGGVAFPPVTRSYAMKINKKLRRTALKSALSIKASEDRIVVIEDFTMTEPKTKYIAGMLKTLGLAGKKVICLIPGKDDVLWKSSRNIPNFCIDMAENTTTYDVFNSDVLLFTRTSVDRVKEYFNYEKQ